LHEPQHLPRGPNRSVFVDPIFFHALAKIRFSLYNSTTRRVRRSCYVLHASTSPSIVEGRFRGRTPDFAALIRSKESKLYRNTSEMGFDMKAVVCSEKKPYSCQALMEFDIPGRYQARITRSPSNKENLCGPETGKPGMPPDLITIVNDDKAMSIQFLFRDGKFSTCSEEDE